MLFSLIPVFAIAVNGLSLPAEEWDPSYEVSRFVLVYDTPHPLQVPIADLQELPLELSHTSTGYTSLKSEGTSITLSEFLCREGVERESSQGTAFYSGYSGKKKEHARFHKSALQAICATLVRYLKEEGLSGVSVQISPCEISADGKDLRGIHQRHLTLHIKLAVVGEVGAFRIEDKQYPSERQLEYIVAHSPLQPSLSLEISDLFSKEKLDDYLLFLNRHPNRRVDARIYPLHQDNHVGIDYLVAENRPWRVFFDVGNTGNHVTGLWQETMGFLHTQLTNVDDVLRLDWTTDSFHSFFTVVGSYERPFMSWIRGRWKLYTMVNRYAAADLGFEDKIFVGTQGVVDLTFRENAAQKGSFFFDISEGIRYYNIHVSNHFDDFNGKGKTQFAAPTLAFLFDQMQSYIWRFSMKLEAVTSPNGFLASNRRDIDLLGRLDASKGWTVLYGHLFTGFYLNSQKPAHEFTFLIQGQYAFDYRLIPQLKFVVGGFNTVRGYTEAINSGDSAVVGRGEYIFHLPPLFSADPRPPSKLFGRRFRAVPEHPGGRADWDFMLRIFLDAARSIDNDRIPVLEENSTLISTGLGTELALWQNFTMRLDWGVTLQKTVKMDAGHNILYLNSTIAY